MAALVAALVAACAAPEPLRPAGTTQAAALARAHELRRTGRTDEALAAYDALLVAEPRLRDAHLALHEIRLARGEALALRREYRAFGDGFLQGGLEGAVDRAAEAYAAAAEPDRTLGRARLAFAEGRLDEALRHYRAVNAMDAARPEAWLGRARIHLIRHESGEAAEAYRHLRWIAPRHPAGWSGAAAVAARAGQRTTATRAAEAALDRAPRDPLLVERLASFASDADSCRRAADALERAGSSGTAVGALAAARLRERAGDPEAAATLRARARAAGALDAEIEAGAQPALPAPIDAFVNRFTAGVEARYRHFRASGEAETFEEFRAWSRALFERETGSALPPPGRIESYAFVGDLIDPSVESDEPLVRALAQHGLALVLGRRAGGPPEAMLAAIVERTGLVSVVSRGRTVRREAIFLGRRYVSGYVEWSGGGDLAGLALGSVVLIDRDASAAWQGRLVRLRDRLRARRALLEREEALADAPVDSVEDPAGVDLRLLLDANPAIEGEVVVHEDAHLVDAARYLPGRGSLLAAFGLALGSGFSAERVLATLERNAQLAAIADGPDPRTALAVCCSALGGRGPHARGYAEIVRGYVDRIHGDPGRFPAIRPDRVLVQQLHRLTADEIRALARELGARWGVWDS